MATFVSEAEEVRKFVDQCNRRVIDVIGLPKKKKKYLFDNRLILITIPGLCEATFLFKRDVKLSHQTFFGGQDRQIIMRWMWQEHM